MRAFATILTLGAAIELAAQTCLVSDGVSIRQLNLDTGVATSMIVRGTQPSLNSDGTRLAFLAGDNRLTLANVDGSNQTIIPLVPDPLQPSWSADDQQIAVQLPFWQGDIWILNADGTDVHSLTYNSQHDWWPTWSADSSRIAFCRVGNGPASQGLYTVQTDRSDLRYLGPGRFSRWSPDGSLLAVGDNDYLRIVRASDGHEVTVIGPLAPDAAFCFTPDMSRVVVVTYGSSLWTGFIYSIDGGGFFPISTPNLRDPTCPRFQSGRVFPRKRTIIQGSGFSDHGLYSFLRVNDSVAESYFPDPETLTATIEFSGLSSVRETQQLSLTLTSKVERPGIAEVFRHYNYSLDRWQVVFGRVATSQYVTSSVVLNGSVSEFVNANRQMRAQIEWSPLNDEDPAQDGWLHFIDQFFWTVQ